MRFVILVMVLNFLICIAVAVACYATKSGWPLLGLLFLKTSVTVHNSDYKEGNDE